MAITLIKTDILSSLRKDIFAVIREVLKNALAEDFEFIKREITVVGTEIANNATAIHAELEHEKANVGAVKEGRKRYQRTVKYLERLVGDLREKFEDLEGGMRRGNIWITEDAEQPGSSSPAAVAKLLKEVFQMDKEVFCENCETKQRRNRHGHTEEGP